METNLCRTHPTPSELIIPVLVVGLGNHGRRYRLNRHNVGFMVVDRLAARLGTQFTRLQTRSLVTDARWQGRRLILSKPQTYMNNSGDAVGALVRFYKLPLDHLFVVYDDLDLPLGTIRLRPAGGSGGHKGMHSIISRLGSQDFPRLRIGVDRPPGRMEPADYLLQDFSPAELEALEPVLDRAVDTFFTLLSAGMQEAMTEFNRQRTDPGDPDHPDED